MDIQMPQLGESVTEGTIGKWLVKSGDKVSKYQPIAEVITDKVNAEIPAPADGVMGELVVSEGSTVPVGTLIAIMDAGDGAKAAPKASEASPTVAAKAAAPASGAAAATVPAAAPQKAEGGARYSPAVLRLAQENEIDLSRLGGTGLGGRITRKNVEAFIAAGGPAEQVAEATAAQGGAPVEPDVARPAGQSTAPAAAPDAAPDAAPAAAAASTAAAVAASTAAAVAASQPRPQGADQLVPVDPVRRRIAEKMRQSKHEAPHAWTMMQVDVTGLVKLREAHGEEFKRREGLSLSYVPFFIKAVVESLKEYPLINSQWAGENIILKHEINISIAVATETALAVPVIKNADRLSIAGLNHAVTDLAKRARAGKLTMDDISGGTFTVNNTGYFGSFMSAPIINHPQAAILSFEAITKTPVVLDNDAIAIHSIMNMCMSLDHRVLDGLICGKFLAAVKTRLQSYGPGEISLY